MTQSKIKEFFGEQGVQEGSNAVLFALEAHLLTAISDVTEEDVDLEKLTLRGTAVTLSKCVHEFVKRNTALVAWDVLGDQLVVIDACCRAAEIHVGDLAKVTERFSKEKVKGNIDTLPALLQAFVRHKLIMTYAHSVHEGRSAEAVTESKVAVLKIVC